MARSKLHPAARWLFRLRAYGLMFVLLIFLIVFSLSIAVGIAKSGWAIAAIGFILFCILILIIIGEIYARLSYNCWAYEFTDTNLKLERGIIWKRYSNIPYERVQNVDIRRGILAQIFGFSSVLVQTAGYSAPMTTGGLGHAGMSAEGFIPAVSAKEAEQIRDFLMRKISKGSTAKQGL